MKKANGRILSNIRISFSPKLSAFFFSPSPCGFHFTRRPPWESIVLSISPFGGILPEQHLN